MDRYIKEKEYTPLNEALAIYGGFDNCWDFPHVYRIPGSKNHKYKNVPNVSKPKPTRKLYKPETLKKLVKAHQPKVEIPLGTESNDLTERQIYAKYNIPTRVREYLALNDLTGVDRSKTIWYIENSLYELGMDPDEIIYLVKRSSFNKYKGRKDEDKRLKDELLKILSGKLDQPGKRKESFEVSTFGDVMGNTNTFEGWLVKGFWGRRSHGIIAGMPKSFKSTLVHDLVVSVASGRPFLGKYPVLDPGPVLVIQNENADYIMRDRTEKLMAHRGLTGKVKTYDDSNLRITMPEDLPIKFINQQGFNMSEDSHREDLEMIIQKEKPVLIVFDPLYLMFAGDINSGQDLNPVLNWLLSLKVKYNTSVALIHHYNKGGANAGKGGARMAGSVFLYGWIESAWYLDKAQEDDAPTAHDEPDQVSNKPVTVGLSREFRMAGQFPDLDIHLTMGEIGEPKYSVETSLADSTTIEQRNIPIEIISILHSSPEPLPLTQICVMLGIDRKEGRKSIKQLEQEKKVIKEDRGYTIYK